MKITETCSCGASICCESQAAQAVYDTVTQWRTTHRCRTESRPDVERRNRS